MYVIYHEVDYYRWWPSEICHPKRVPHNIQEKTHQVGEFPVHFFGTNDYFWIHKGRLIFRTNSFILRQTFTSVTMNKFCQKIGISNIQLHL